MRQKVTALTVFVILILTGGACADSQLTILANPGDFSTIEEAAVSEEKVNWWDGNLADDRACTESFAAVELAHFLSSCTKFSKSDIVLSSAKKLPRSCDVIVIGSRQSNPLIDSLNTVSAEQLKTNESFRIKTFADNGRTVTVIEGKDRVGTLYGVYTYLERLGIRFYGLGDKFSPRAGTDTSVTVLIATHTDGKAKELKFDETYKVPSHGTVYPDAQVELLRDLDIIQNPDYQIRGMWAWQDIGNEEFFLWMGRNKLNLWTSAEKEVHLLKKLGMQLTDGSHFILEYTIGPRKEYPYNHPKFKGDEDKPKDPYATGSDYSGDTNGDGKLAYFEAHPEWFGLIKGKRSDDIRGDFGDNYCTSNKDATRELAENLVQELIDGRYRHTDILRFTLLDNGNWCECDNCKLQGFYTDRIFDISYVILDEMRRAKQQGRLQRKVALSICAYHETLAPPVRPLPDDFDYDNFTVHFAPIERCYVHALADPACTETNKYVLEYYQKWTQGKGRNYKGSIHIGEYYNVSSFKSLPLVFVRSMAADIPWYYRTGTSLFEYMHVPMRSWGTWTLNQRLYAQLLWDIDTNVDNLLDEYFKRYYPTTSEHTRKFYKHLEAASANIKVFKHYVGFGGIVLIDGIRYSLRSRLTGKQGEIFLTEHLKYDSHHSVVNDGPDIVEMMESMRLARKELDAALFQCTDKLEQVRLLEAERRFAYGEAMYSFYYHLVRTAIFHRDDKKDLARNEFKYVSYFADQLQEVTDLVHVGSSHVNAVNGFEATQAVKVYDFFKNKYGK